VALPPRDIDSTWRWYPGDRVALQTDETTGIQSVCPLVTVVRGRPSVSGNKVEVGGISGALRTDERLSALQGLGRTVALFVENVRSGGYAFFGARAEP
jgi:hypothetical protein